MALFDFLKKTTSKKKSSLDSLHLSFAALLPWVKNKQVALNKKERLVFDSLRDTLTFLHSQLEKKLPLLENVNLDKKKTDSATKLIVMNSVKTYVALVRRLLKNSDDLEFITLEDYAFKLDKYFADFFKNSLMSYQKVTFLVGKEIEGVKDLLVKTYRRQQKINEANENLVSRNHELHSIQLKIEAIDEMKKNDKEFHEKLKLLDEHIRETKKKKKKLLEDVNVLRASKMYLENQKISEEINKHYLQLKKEYADLKRLVNFKALANEFHTSAKYMNIIKSFREDFITSFEQDDGKLLLSLLKEAKLSTQAFLTKTNQIITNKQKIKNKKALLKEQKVPVLLNELEKVKQDIHRLEEEKAQELSILKKISDSQKTALHSLEQLLSKESISLEIKK